jgi:hypothetical protein
LGFYKPERSKNTKYFCSLYNAILSELLQNSYKSEITLQGVGVLCKMKKLLKLSFTWLIILAFIVSMFSVLSFPVKALEPLPEVSLGDTINLSSDSERSLVPEVAASENNVYVVWWNRVYGVGQLLFKRSIDYGATFGSMIRLSYNTGGEAGYPPQMIASGENVYIAWEGAVVHQQGSFPGTPTVASDIFLAMSNSNGKSQQQSCGVN